MNRLAGQPGETVILRVVVAQHILDGLTSGNPTAADRAQSLLTELDAAGLDLSDAIKAVNS